MPLDSLSELAPIVPICLVDELGNKVNLNFLGLIKGDVVNFAALPAASLHSGEYYMVQTPQGTWVLGTKKRAGIYRSNGSTWVRMGILPIDDTQTTTENLWSASKIASEIGAASGLVYAVTAISSSPYVVLTTDVVILVDTVPMTVTLPASPVDGQTFIIKDRTGNAIGANSVTISGNGNNIDGNPSEDIKSKFGSITIIFEGSDWSII